MQNAERSSRGKEMIIIPRSAFRTSDTVWSPSCAFVGLSPPLAD
jgi:hypothetical protein